MNRETIHFIGRAGDSRNSQEDAKKMQDARTPQRLPKRGMRRNFGSSNLRKLRKMPANCSTGNNHENVSVASPSSHPSTSRAIALENHKRGMRRSVATVNLLSLLEESEQDSAGNNDENVSVAVPSSPPTTSQESGSGNEGQNNETKTATDSNKKHASVEETNGN